MHHRDLRGCISPALPGVQQHVENHCREHGEIQGVPADVGETGGKDYVFADETADPIQVATALTRGAFEYQGQKCSAASRAFIPSTLWEEVKERLSYDMSKIKTGVPEDFSNFVNAVIDEESFDKLAKAIEDAKLLMQKSSLEGITIRVRIFYPSHRHLG